MPTQVSSIRRLRAEGVHTLSKLQAENRTQAAVQAPKRGLVSSDELS